MGIEWTGESERARREDKVDGGSHAHVRFFLPRDAWRTVSPEAARVAASGGKQSFSFLFAWLILPLCLSALDRSIWRAGALRVVLN
jgi:hypothetical protein